MSLHCTDFLIGLLTRLQVAFESGISRGRTGDADDAWIGLIAPHEAGILDASSGCRDLEAPGGNFLVEELLHGGAEEMRSRAGRSRSDRESFQSVRWRKRCAGTRTYAGRRRHQSPPTRPNAGGQGRETRR